MPQIFIGDSAANRQNTLTHTHKLNTQTDRQQRQHISPHGADHRENVRKTKTQIRQKTKRRKNQQQQRHQRHQQHQTVTAPSRASNFPPHHSIAHHTPHHTTQCPLYSTPPWHSSPPHTSLYHTSLHFVQVASRRVTRLAIGQWTIPFAYRSHAMQTETHIHTKAQTYTQTDRHTHARKTIALRHSSQCACLPFCCLFDTQAYTHTHPMSERKKGTAAAEALLPLIAACRTQELESVESASSTAL